MKKLLKIGMLWLAASPLLGQDLASSGASEALLRAMEGSWSQAVVAKDLKVLDMLLAPELVYVDDDGKLMSRQQYIASVKSSDLHPERVTTQSMTVHSYGNMAVVSGLYLKKGTRNGKAYVLRERFTDTWVMRHGNWVCVASHSTLIGP
jgi:ketosteroid isomerase-like protein